MIELRPSVYAAGDSVSLEATVTPPVTDGDYQWFSRCPGSTDFGAIPGAVAATYGFLATEELDGCAYLVKLSVDGVAGESLPVTLVVGAADPGPDPDPDPGSDQASQLIVGSVDGLQGALVISVDPNDRTVTLPIVQLSPEGDRLESGGELRPVTVIDTRSGTPGWAASGQVGDFTGDAGGALDGKYLGWNPSVLSATGGGVAPGPSVSPALTSGSGLKTSSVLASAPAGEGRGTALLGAGLVLEVPTQTPPGTRTATMTLTVI